MARPGPVRREVSSQTAQTLDLEIEDISVDGDGVARAGRQTIHVPFTIPGERVRVRVTRGPGPLAAATLVSILKASPHRVSPRCSHFGPEAVGGMACGGCSWQHIAYPQQLKLKTSLVERLVRARVPSAPRVDEMVGASRDEPWGFRQKVHFVFGDSHDRRGSSQLLMGHFVRGSRRVVGVRECPVHDTRGNAAAFALHQELSRSGVRAASPHGDHALRSVAVRVAFATDELMATLVVSRESDRRLRTATRKVIAGAPAGTSFHLNVHARSDGFIFGHKSRTLAGSDRLRDEIFGASYLMSPTSFFQTNVAAASLLVSRVLDAMPSPPARVLDLYAGAGLFAIPLARAGHKVTAVESNRQAVADGIASARLNRLSEDQCRFIVTRTEDVLSGAPPADAVVVDPPREGCAPAVVDRLFGQLRPPVGVYVSCNPEALADDLARIVKHGYQIRSLLPVDMFPHTAHIETVAVLAK